MRRLWMKLGVVTLTLGTFGGLATPSVASAKAKPRFKTADLTRYYKSAKTKTAFHIASLTDGKKTQPYVILGDFDKAINVQHGILQGKGKVSKNGRTLTFKYKLVTYKTANQKTVQSLSKKVYTFKLTKKSATKFTAYLTKGTNRRLATKGTKVTYTQTKTSPAQSYMNKYGKSRIDAYSKTVAAQNAKQNNWTTAQEAQVATQISDQLSSTLVKMFY